jgi:transmembrane sensor
MRPPGSTSSRAEDRIRREAAAWFAKLRGPDSARQRARYEAWRAADPAHAAMFDRLSHRWAESGVLARSERVKSRPDPAPVRDGFRWGLAGGLGLAGALAACAFLGALYWPAASDLAPPLPLLGWSAPMVTPVGEIRRIRFPDGGLVILDTDTAVSLRVVRGLSEVRLLRGRVEVETSNTDRRSLRVSAGRATALAKAGDFDVSLSPDQTASITLVEGDVLVETRSAPWPIAREALRLTPGQQVRLAKGAPPPMVGPAPAYQTGWVQGVLDFRGTPLGDAVAEVNRYGRQKIVLQDPALDDLQISGRVYPASAADFAASVASMFDLALSRGPNGDFILSRRAPR